MAYRQEPGRGPMATFKNVTSLLGPTANGVDPKTGVKTVEVERKATHTGGNVNDMIRRGYQPRGANVIGGKTQYHQFNNNPDKNNKLHMQISRETYRDLLSKGQGDRLNKSKFTALKDIEERDMSGALHQSMTDQVTKGEMAGNFEAKKP